jgi:hypothetical protein
MERCGSRAHIAGISRFGIRYANFLHCSLLRSDSTQIYTAADTLMHPRRHTMRVSTPCSLHFSCSTLNGEKPSSSDIPWYIPSTDHLHALSLTPLQGGGVAAAFTAQFPYLVEDKVVLISCAGLVEASDLSRTAKFMSSPLVLTLASGGPVRVSRTRLLPKSSLILLLIPQTYFQRLTNTSSISTPDANSPAVDTMPDKMDSPLMEVRYLHSLLLASDLTALLSCADRPPTISTPHRVQCCNIFLAQGRPGTWASSLVLFKWIRPGPTCTFASCTSN